MLKPTFTYTKHKGMESRKIGLICGGWLEDRRGMIHSMPAKSFRPGDRVSWNSEAGRVTGTIQKKVTAEITFKGYKRRATRDDPQYIIKSEKTDHVAIHKGSALRKLAGKRHGRA